MFCPTDLENQMSLLRQSGFGLDLHASDSNIHKERKGIQEGEENDEEEEEEEEPMSE